MNLPAFLRQVDQLCGEMSLKQCTLAVHELARVLPEERRQDFLDVLRNSINRSGEKAEEKFDNVDEEIAGSLKALKRISRGSAVLDCEINEEYDDWYNSDVNEFNFEDPQDLVMDIEKAIRLLHMCVDSEKYQLGKLLVNELSGLRISVSESSN